MTRCPACQRSWNDVDRHLQFVHQETTLLVIDAPALGKTREPAAWITNVGMGEGGSRQAGLGGSPASLDEPVWVPIGFALLALAALGLVVS